MKAKCAQKSQTEFPVCENLLKVFVCLTNQSREEKQNKLTKMCFEARENYVKFRDNGARTKIQKYI